jgi:hypothetical protein
MARLLAHRENEIPSLRTTRPGVPKMLDGLCRRMMAKDPEDRPKTMAWVIAALEEVRDELSERAKAQEITGPGGAAGDPARSGKYLSPAESRVATSFDISDLLTDVASEVHPPQMVLGSRRYRGRLRLTRPLAVVLVVSGVGTLLLALKLARMLLGRP